MNNNQNKQFFLPYGKIDDLLKVLHGGGYKCLAPQLIEGSITYSEITSQNQLPWGVTDEQSPGHYKTFKSDNKHAFGFTLPVQSVKPMLFKAKENVFKVVKNSAGKIEFKPELEVENIAVFGVRPCDLRAVTVQDKVFVDNEYTDARYIKRREKQFLIAMNCSNSHANCFCVSLGNGAKAQSGFDLAMTEVDSGFIVEVGSSKGSTVLDKLSLSEANSNQLAEAGKAIQYAEAKQTKKLPGITAVREGLLNNLEHEAYDDVTKRCLSCGNCTNSCPTCFCHTQKEEPSVAGDVSHRVREWDSCFTIEHSYTHGEIFRDNPKYRYRQWVTHKFATWHDQFEVSGCVGCGRCITWCPVKIDVVDEINLIVSE